MPFALGQKAAFTKQITARDVRAFAELSGDTNPVHLDENYARQSRFGARIAHGALSVALISAVLGSQLPGEGTVYLSQSIKFVKPVYFDDTITATAEIIALRADKGIVTLKTVCANQRGEVVAEGEAVVLNEKAKQTGN